jgi:uncharacterized membrane protein YhhN
MNKQTSLLLHLLLLLIAIIELLGRLLDQINLEYAVKPLIMVWMAAYFLLAKQKRTFTIPVLLAFFFSWLGDLFLMFSGGYDNELFFFAGVGAFFLAQLTYIYVFSNYSEYGGRGYLQRHWWLAIPFVAYVLGIYFLLQPGLEGVMRPVILVYALSLMLMSMAALNRRHRVNYKSYLLVFIGSLLFLTSDSMIAINKFYASIPLAGFWIMLFYMSAQYLITRGLSREG